MVAPPPCDEARGGDSGGSEGSSLVGATRPAEPRSRRWPGHEPGEGQALWSLQETTLGAGADTRAIVPDSEQRAPGVSGDKVPFAPQAARRPSPIAGLGCQAGPAGARGQRTGLGMEAPPAELRPGAALSDLGTG